jgi:uridine kinase
MAITYEELIERIEKLRHIYNAFAIAIDGMAYAGKTTLAAHLSQKYGAPVIHMDDFVLPVEEREAGWEQTPGAEIDFERFNEEISEPWMKRKPLVYSLRDAKSGEYTERVALPDAQIYLIEGTYCTHPLVLDFYDLHLFCKIPPALQAQRAEAAHTPLDEAVRARQEQYFITNMTEALSDEVLDETFAVPEAPSSEG